MKNKNWKQILALTLGFTLTFSQAVYAASTVTMISVPFETAVAAEDGASYAGNDIQRTQAQPSESGKESVLVAGSGQAMSSMLTQPTPSVMAGAQMTQMEAVPSALTQPIPSSQETTAETSAAVSSGQILQEEITIPTVSSEGAVLMDAATGQVLFGKNENQQFYPASITKVMTALLVLEHCRLDEVVTFSATATTDLESGAVALGIVEGDQLTVEQCLYGLLLKSANEIGNGLAEHVAGSISAFADMMNEKARALGCKNTNFVNPHGLNNTEHKTTPYDMALILRAALQNETFRKIDTTRTYDFPATKNAEARTITMGHKMMYPSDSRYYEGIIGGKTGYTSKAGNTLVTGAERDGVRLVAVVMKSQGTHYSDTKAMLDYGFKNYEALTGRKAGSMTAGSSSSQTGGSTALQGPAGSTDASAASSLAAPETTAAVPEITAAPETTAAVPEITAAPETTAAVTETIAAAETQAADANTRTGWIQDSNGWYYIKDDDSRAAGEWLTLDGYDYWFDSNGYMATGWRRFTNGAWYYFRPHNGTMARNRWVEDGGAWYYLGDDGVLLTNTTTPDGYPVDENGIWIQ